MAVITPHVAYMRQVVNDLDGLVDRIAALIAAAPEDSLVFDTIVGRGLSGCLILPTLAKRLGCHWLAVRKENDGTHSHLCAEGSLGDRWLFVDDLISTGATLRKVKEAVAKVAGVYDHQTEYAGAVLYFDMYLQDSEGVTL